MRLDKENLKIIRSTDINSMGLLIGGERFPKRIHKRTGSFISKQSRYSKLTESHFFKKKMVIDTNFNYRKKIIYITGNQYLTTLDFLRCENWISGDVKWK